MTKYCLRNGKIQTIESEPAGNAPAALFHLTAEGGIQRIDTPQPLQKGEGLLMYGGEVYIEPLEIQIEFIKADNARSWLEALVLRHAERARQVTKEIWIWAEMEEAGI